jgi:hypothetical protein
MSKAFIIGNGLSRKGFDFNKLNEHTTFGCNAIFTEYKPSYIVAIDDEMIKRLSKVDYPQHRVLVPPEHERWELNGTGRRNNAGMCAMYAAIRRGATHLYCLGFDFLIEESDDSTKTVYDGQEGYNAFNRATLDDNINRAKYLDWFASVNPMVVFDFVFPRAKMALRTVNAPNVRAMYYDDLERIL